MTTPSYDIHLIHNGIIDDALAEVPPPFCDASTDSLFVSMLECGRRCDHDGPHYDFRHDMAWIETLEGGHLVDLETA